MNTGIALKLLLLFVCSAIITIARSNFIIDDQKLSRGPLKLDVTRTHVVMDNGLIKVTLTNPSGSVAAIEYNGIDNILEPSKKETDRGEWDIVWSTQQTHSRFDLLFATEYKIIIADQHQIEVSFTKSYNSHDAGSVPLIVDKRYVLLPGQSGFYTYAIIDHPQGWPDVNIAEIRLAFNLRKNLFSYMAISDDIQRVMPTAKDRTFGHTLAYKEAELLTNPSNSNLKGEVDDKYQYSLESNDIKVHGWVCPKPHVGFWVISASRESISGGPIKQDLTSHCGPTSLMVFYSSHYAGPGFTLDLQNGEKWSKVFGPTFIYLNSDSGNDPKTLWKNAKEMSIIENRKWPYDFPKSHDYPLANFRGTVAGRLLVRDRFISRGIIFAKSAFIGLAAPGDVGSWQNEVKNYQFWTQTNDRGFFEISAVRSGIYNLYAWVPGILGDFKYRTNIVIRPGDKINLSNIVFDPPRNGPTLWEIGVPDRKASEFFIPDPEPSLVNKVFINLENEKFRQYGLWDRYTDYYPNQDLVYTVGKSDYRKDWFFAHVNRVGRNNDYESTTWRIIFGINNVNRRGTYTLRIALAASNFADILIWINNKNTRPNFEMTGLGRDNSIARHGIHGLYSEHTFTFPGLRLVNGQNTIFLQQTRSGNPFIGVMYDYIRLEGPH